jgi:hypothetical protein
MPALMALMPMRFALVLGDLGMEMGYCLAISDFTPLANELSAVSFSIWSNLLLSDK